MAVPTHVAIIADGNRRWAKEKGLLAFLGHTEGAKNVERVVKAAITHGVRHLTIYALSTENLKQRSKEELAHLFTIFGTIIDYEALFHEQEAQFRTIGDLAGVPSDLQERLVTLAKRTEGHDRIVVTIAINYGGRDEVVRAMHRALKEKNEAIISESSFGAFLDTAGLPDVDLVIRTGGHHRLSNFLLWQTAYAELYFTDTHWPAFDAEEFGKAIAWYEEQTRNHGK